MNERPTCTVGRFTIIIFIFLLTTDVLVEASYSLLDSKLVHIWAERLGAELKQIGDNVARKKEAQNSFMGAHVVERDGNKLVQDIAANVYDLLKAKKEAVQAIVNEAEAIVAERLNKEAPLDYVYITSKISEPRPTYLPYAVVPNKTITKSPHFGNMEINTNYSSVHVPTDISDWANSSRKDAEWSENLDKVFITNYERDRSLSWQYFGSATGIMRHYPAMNWLEDDEITDLYDCRLRAWFTEAAKSSMDMIIIIDMSGSMQMGYNIQIAWQIMSNLLDTLGNNDYVNVLKMTNDTIFYVVPCFEDTLVQANFLNVREFKSVMQDVEPHGLANFHLALNKSFEILNNFRRGGNRCHQSIMLISDGFYFNYFDVFKEFNLKYLPDLPVRVFTYLIGFKSDDTREGIWMACANRGFFVHVENEAEVRPKVLKYIPVVARPLALFGDQHPLIWTPVYANIIDSQFNDYEWGRKLAENQKKIIKVYRHNKTVFKTREQKIKRYNRTQKEQNDQFGKPTNYMLMTSISMPAFNKSRENPLDWNLLGVAGTDIPIEELKILMIAQRLGVNGYAFIMTNNGYILFHPDFRPVFQGILKPGYNVVDMLEVELKNDRRGPRDFHIEIINLRNEILEQWNGSRRMEAKYHYENMSRVSTIQRHYYWTGIKETVFSIVIVVPELYGKNLVVGVSSHHDHRSGHNSEYFQNPRFKVHPDWLYCKDYKINFPSPEEQLKYFMHRLKLSRVDEKYWSPTRRQNNSLICDYFLMQSILLDAQNTLWFYQNLTKSNDDPRLINRIKLQYGLVSVFIATHSGLTRWQTFMSEYGEFGDKYPRATDEIWYHRAVEQCVKSPKSYVYSVNLDASDAIVDGGQAVLVTASHAIYHVSNKLSAPAAVIGYQFHHSGLHGAFMKIVTDCKDPDMCERTCKSKNLRCFVLDNNGYILVAKSRKHTGKFFGEVLPTIMQQMLQEKIYEEINIPDYQGVCFVDPEEESSSSNVLLTPFVYMKNSLKYLAVYVFWLFESFTQITVEGYNAAYLEDDAYDEETTEEIPTSTTPKPKRKKKPTRQELEKEEQEQLLKWTEMHKLEPTPCDREAKLYKMLSINSNANRNMNTSEPCKRPFLIEPIPDSNLLLVVVNDLCKMEDDIWSTKPVQVNYDDSLVCQRMTANQFGRKPLQTCVKHHPNEDQIKLCGGGSSPSKFSLSFFLFIAVIFKILFWS